MLEAARCEMTDYKRWLPWICCFTGCRLDEPAGAAVPDIEQVGSYWVLNVRLSWMPGWFREPFAVTCAAQVGTVPFMATNFHVLSPSGPLANALVLPLLPALVGAGLLVAPLALIPGVGQTVALPLVGLLNYIEQVAGILASALRTQSPNGHGTSRIRPTRRSQSAAP